jgi:hypothetical protein
MGIVAIRGRLNPQLEITRPLYPFITYKINLCIYNGSAFSYYDLANVYLAKNKPTALCAEHLDRLI